MTPELHRPVALDRVSAGSLDVEVTATAAECAALAARLRVPAVEALACRWRLRRGAASSVEAEGALRARVVRTCVVTAEDFPTEVAEEFAVRFVPEGRESDDADPDAPDEIPYAGTAIDLGEATAEQLALALDPYPRRPGAALPEEQAPAEPSPFAALGRLRRPD